MIKYSVTYPNNRTADLGPYPGRQWAVEDLLNKIKGNKTILDWSVHSIENGTVEIIKECKRRILDGLETVQAAFGDSFDFGNPVIKIEIPIQMK